MVRFRCFPFENVSENYSVHTTKCAIPLGIHFITLAASPVKETDSGFFHSQQ